MKRIRKISFISILIGSTIFTGCANSKSLAEDEKDEQVIGVVMSTFDDTWKTSVRNVLYESAQEEVEVDIWSADNSQEEENKKVDELINLEVDALAVNLVSLEGAGPIIDKAKKADIPVIFFNVEPSLEDMKLWDKVYYVGAKAEQSGIMQGQMLADYFKSHQTPDGVINYVMLKGPEENQDAKLRSKYSVETIQQNGLKTELLTADIAMWEREKAEEKMAEFLQSQGEGIDCVIANNDDMALGAIDALKGKGYFDGNKYMPVVGVDATDAARSAVQKGLLLGTVLNDDVNQGKAIYNLASVLISGQMPNKDNVGYEIADDKYIWIDYKMITKENAANIN